MRRIAVIAAVAVLATSPACNREKKEEAPAAPGGETAAPATPSTPAGPAALPRRKPGLWEMTMRMDGEDRVTTSRLCLDEATESRMAIWGGAATADMCEKNLVTPRPDGSVQFAAVCDMGSGGKTTSVGVAEGDLTSNYTVRVQSSTEGASVPQMNGAHHFTIASRRIGPCEAGQRGGDMMLPGGVTVNINDTPLGPHGKK